MSSVTGKAQTASPTFMSEQRPGWSGGDGGGVRWRLGFSPLIWWITARTALKALLVNKTRSVLAMLGIIIGIGAVIAMLAVGTGAQAQIMARFQAMGTNILFVRAVSRSVNGVSVGRPSLTLADAQALLELPGVKAVSPEALMRVQVVYLDRNQSVQTIGVAAPYFRMRHFELERGRVFNEMESDSLGRVVVLGSAIARGLFGNEEAVGETVKLNNINFKVVGVLKSKGDQGWADPDSQVFLPYTTSMKILSAVSNLWIINVEVEDGVSLDEVAGQPSGGAGSGLRGLSVHKTPPAMNSITGLLRNRHQLKSLAVADDFIIQSNAKLLADSSASAKTFGILLGTIASISLLVGGIGIMNIMLVTVTERTREIGIRKAIGAKNRTVLTQFLIEAVIMSGLGGMLGAGLGVLAAWVIGIFAATPGSNLPVPIVQMTYVLLSVSISGAVGVFFGVYPAWKASQLDPIVALRYE